MSTSLPSDFLPLRGRRLGYGREASDGRLWVNGNIHYPAGGQFSVTGGEVFYVNSAATGAADTNTGKNPSLPFATLDAAIGACTANQGDTIVVAENHAETITGDGGLALDVAGIRIVGQGWGNQRPRLLMDAAATVTAEITAADVWIENIVFAAGHADIVTCIEIAEAGATLIGVEFEDNAADENFLTPIKCTSTTDNNADNLSVVGCRWISPDAACLEFIEINADLNGARINGNFVVTSGTASPLVLCATGKDLTGLMLQGNTIQSAMTAGDLLIDNDTSANTGIVAFNLVGHLDTAAEVISDCDGVHMFENYASGVVTASGYLLPAADS